MTVMCWQTTDSNMYDVNVLFQEQFLLGLSNCQCRTTFLLAGSANFEINFSTTAATS